MTRANIEIIRGIFSAQSHQFQSNSSAYPSYMLEYFVKAVQSSYSLNRGATDNFYTEIDSCALSELVENCGLTLGSVGNPSYYYTLDFFNKRLIVRETQRYWVNAPEDWEAKGWQGCYENNGKFGYHDIRKGKPIFDAHFSQLVGKRGGMKTVEIENKNDVDIFTIK